MFTAERLWTIEDVAEYLGVPVKTIYDWRTRNYGPPGRKVGRYVRYRAEDVRAWVDALDPGMA
jgi:excisionase family DNA binding protein